MTRKQDQGKRVWRGDIYSEPYICPTGPQWARFQQKLLLAETSERRLTEGCRKDIELLTSLYAAARQSGEGSWTAIEAKKEFALWRRRTELFRKNVWHQETRWRPTTSYWRFLVDGHRSRRIRRYEPMQLIAHALDGAVAVIEGILRQITSPRFVGTELDLWPVWIVGIVELLRKDQITVVEVNSSGKPRLKHGFVAFVGCLQKTLPASCRRRQDGESLRKGILDSINLIGTTETELVFQLLAGRTPPRKKRNRKLERFITYMLERKSLFRQRRKSGTAGSKKTD